MAAFFVEGSTGNIGIGHNTPILDSSIAGTSVPSGTKYVHVNDGEGAVIKLTTLLIVPIVAHSLPSLTLRRFSTTAKQVV